MMIVAIIIPFFLFKWLTGRNIVRKPQTANKMLYAQLRRLEKNKEDRDPEGKDGSVAVSAFVKPDA